MIVEYSPESGVRLMGLLDFCGFKNSFCEVRSASPRGWSESQSLTRTMHWFLSMWCLTPGRRTIGVGTWLTAS